MHHTKGLSTNRSPKLNEDEQMNEKLASEKSNQIEKKDSNQICTDPTENLLIRSTKGTTPESPRSPITKLTRAMEGSPHDVEPDTKRSKEVVMPVNDDSVEEVFRFEYTADRTSSEDRALLLPSAESAMVTSPPIRHRALDGLRSTPKPASARVTSLTRRLRQHIRRNPYFMDSLPGPPMIEDPQPTPEAEVHSRKRIALGTPTISPKRLKLHDLPRVDRFKATKDTLQQMEVIGQVDHSFILCRLEGQLLAVDQHAVGERVNLERFAAEQRELPPDRASQPVDFTLNVSPDDSFHLTSLQSQVGRCTPSDSAGVLGVRVHRG
ncbi:MAG: uncharacterized protein KVP18_002348 [Porospora cf. gigantea A]|uniref:uncharacterized protein n=1 Tax=Porospora cf. gigantea A TaxID=2853593 RepID=UPI003559F769|nr:MAG: hypothetical protein KVP18_002348 [Porospora cf. gigantea A]